MNKVVKFFKAELKKTSVLLLLLLALSLANLGCAGPAWRGWSGFASQDGVLYFGSMDGKVLAINPSARSQGATFPGEGEWVFKIPTVGAPGGMCGPLGCAPAAPPVDVYATPVVAGDLVCVATYAGQSGKLVAIDRLSPGYTEGVPLRSKGEWTYPSGVKSIGAIVGSPVVVESTLYVGSSDGKVYALDAVYGEKKWEFNTGAKIWTSPAVKDGVVYISNYGHKFFALSSTDGSLLWEIELPAAIASSPAVSGEKVFFGTFDHQLYAVDHTNGDVKWTFEGGNWFWSTPVVKGDVVYAGCLDHRVYALKASTGEEIWQFAADSQIVSTPVLVDNLLVLASESGKIYMLKVDNGDSERTVSIGGPIVAPLYAEKDTVYVHARNRCVYSVNAQSGEIAWKFCYSDIK